MLYLDYLAYHNRLSRFSIGEKLLLGGGGLLLALALPGPAVALALVLVMHLVMLYAGMPPGYLLRLWLAPLTFLLIGLASVAISISSQPFDGLAVFQAGPYYLGFTQTGIAAAAMLAFRSIAAVSCLFMIASTTPVAHLAAYLARYPGVRSVSEVALLTYRFVFVLLAAAGQIYTAQQSRLGYAGPRRSVRSLSLLAANVGRKAFLTARELFVALSARNYSDRLSHYYPAQGVRPLRIVGILALLGAIGLTACL